MIEFVRGILVCCFKILGYIAASALITGFIADCIGISSVTAFLYIWAFIGIVIFTFPKFFFTPL